MSKKILTAAGISFALLGAIAMPTQAVAGDTHAEPITAQHDDHLTVVRDAETGKLRPPTPEEFAVMQQARAAKARNFRAAPRPALQKYHRSGARGARVSDEFEVLSVAASKPECAADTACADVNDAAARPSTALKTETE
ncbi:hypothetical protein CR105_12660 [Massilia eurypsychrophila]|jgi:hypothetical protein|uniref:DUF4148 domain-containing protein n=1 Tax=Massilia eurypsychrophila TaxID=1485217 RepID=A0A2G8TFC5_9BURK|nr:hypothetical protein [Massilia eurypsychrophila]PIL44757.1 hypothetical protein CR105_12660 [Massilia eurypsychrophila]